MSLEKLILQPNDNQMEAIKKNLKEDKERFENNLKLFEKWAECQPHIPKNYERNMLSTFLRGCKHDMEEAKRKFQNFLLCRSTMPDLFHFDEFTPEEQEIADRLFVFPMPKLTDEGHRVSYFSMKTSNLDEFDLSIFAKKVWTIGNIRACHERPNIGEIYIFDAINFTFSHSPKLLGPQLKKSIFVSQEAFPFRINAVYVINSPPFIEKVVNIVTMFFKEKIRNRIFIDKGMDILKKLPEKCLPIELGGTDLSINNHNNNWIKYIKENRSWIESQKNVKLIGEIPKQIEESCYYEDGGDIGVQGSFRQLTID